MASPPWPLLTIHMQELCQLAYFIENQWFEPIEPVAFRPCCKIFRHRDTCRGETRIRPAGGPNASGPRRRFQQSDRQLRATAWSGRAARPLREREPVRPSRSDVARQLQRRADGSRFCRPVLAGRRHRQRHVFPLGRHIGNLQRAFRRLLRQRHGQRGLRRHAHGDLRLPRRGHGRSRAGDPGAARDRSRCLRARSARAGADPSDSRRLSGRSAPASHSAPRRRSRAWCVFATTPLIRVIFVCY